MRKKIRNSFYPLLFALLLLLTGCGNGSDAKSTPKSAETVTPGAASEITPSEAADITDVTSKPSPTDITDIASDPSPTEPADASTDPTPTDITNEATGPVPTDTVDETNGTTPLISPSPQAAESNPPHTHTFGGWIIDEEASCELKGLKSRKCSVCGKTETQDIEPLGHRFGDWKTVSNATCVGEGSQERSCTVCGKKETATVKAKGHNYGEWTTVKAATCTEKGSRKRTCLVCGAEDKQTVDAKGHSWSNWKILKEATIFEAGEKTRSCQVCSKTETAVIDIIVPTDEEKTAMALKVAKQIAENAPKNASDIDKVTYAAEAVSDYCSRCNYTMEGKDYKLPYGVFVKGEYSCAGATRALGMVLECMGFKWKHVNEHQYTHQWCELQMDGQIGWADGQIGMAGYGEFPFY